MKTQFITASICIMLISAGNVFAGDPHDPNTGQGKIMEYLHSKKGLMDEQSKGVQEHADDIKVGNRICPVSGELIPEGDEIEYEYNGKIYNLCCKMCAKDFKKNPEKFSRIAEELMLKEHGTAHEKQESPGHSHSQLEQDGEYQHDEYDHECEGAGCVEK